MMPNGWQKTDLNDLIHIKHGFAFKSDYFRESGDYILLTPGSFYEKGGFKNQGNKTKYYIGEIPDTYLLSKNDLLIAMTEQAQGLLGSALFVPEDDLYLHNQRLGKVQIQSNDEICSEFLYLTFNSPFARKQITEQSTGTKVKHTSPDKLKSIICLLPPLPEQQEIANILSTWDKAISTTEHLIDNSTQQKKALMQQLLTGKKRLLDDEGERFEGEWEEGKLSDFAKIKKGKALSSKDLKEGSYPVIAGGKSSPYTHSDFTYENIITVSASGAYAGYIAFFPYKIWASDCSVVEPKGDNNIKYLYYWLSNQQQKIYTLQSGGAQPHIYPRDLDSLKISIPYSKEQQKIATVLTNADKEIELLEQQLADLQQEKKALMQVLLTGKKRVVVD